MGLGTMYGGGYNRCCAGRGAWPRRQLQATRATTGEVGVETAMTTASCMCLLW